MTLSYWLCATITEISAVVSLGFSSAAALKSTGEGNVNTLYTCARSLALVIASAVPLFGGVSWLPAVACSMIIVQACDAVIGVRINEALKTWGPAGTAALNLAALVCWLT